jgi:hypothetical protein
MNWITSSITMALAPSKAPAIILLPSTTIPFAYCLASARARPKPRSIELSTFRLATAASETAVSLSFSLLSDSDCHL